MHAKPARRDHAASPPLRSARAWLGLLLVAVAVRAGVLLLAADFSGRDADSYRLLAQELWSHGRLAVDGLPTALRPPLYPLLLAPCLALGERADVAIGVLHVLLGVATVVAATLVAAQWGAGRGAWLAGVLVLADPILLNQSRLVMSETAAACLAAWSLWALGEHEARASSRWFSAWALASGALLGLASICRPELFLWSLGIPCVFLFARPWPTARLRAACGIVLIALVPVAGWALRNARQLGETVLLTNHGGYTLLLANNPYYYDYLRQPTRPLAWDSAEFDRDLANRRPHRPGKPPAQFDPENYREAWSHIRAEPAMFLRASAHRVARLWSPLPYPRDLEESGKQRALRYAIAAWYAIVDIAALAGLARLGRRAVSPPIVWGLWMLASFTAIHSLYWSDMRMRAPLAVVVAALAGRSWGGGRRRAAVDASRGANVG